MKIEIKLKLVKISEEVIQVCGRFIMSDPSFVKERFEIEKIVREITPSYNIAPTHEVPVVINEQGRELTAMRWGLIPYWVKDPSIGNKLINARSETLEDKPSFRHCLERRRCLIVTDGFYEWKRVGREKKPYLITLRSRQPFAFAGLWDSWRAPDGKIIQSCTIITTEANELMQPLHSRMPVILTPETEKIWLDQSMNDLQSVRQLKTLLNPYPSADMTLYEVSPLVNSPQNNSPECILPMDSLF